MTSAECLLLGTLRASGAISAVRLGHRCSVPHESLYEALVSLEAAGLARVIVNHTKHTHTVLWRAA